MSAQATFGLVIGGRPSTAGTGSTRPVLDPANNRPFAEVTVGTVDDARAALEAADRAYQESWWAGDDGSRRAKTLYRLAQRLEERSKEFALLETHNTGKPLREAGFDIGYVVRTLEYYAGLADKIQGETISVPGSRLDFTLREPLGATVHLAPWNYPLLLAIRSVAPALAAGNSAVLKPASLTPLTALRFGELATEAGVPAGILNVVTGGGATVGEALVRDPRCRSVAFTGSLDVGRRIATLAAERVVPVTLELGGKGPVVVLPDADLDRAARGVVQGIFGNAGQMCWAGSRLIVQEGIRTSFLEKVRALAEALKVGPGVEETAEMGPLVSREHAEHVLDFVRGARDDGGSVLTGGARATEARLAEGNFVLPTVLVDAPETSRAVREEIFGPVLTASSFSDLDDAVAQANRTNYGLFATVWTKDLASAHTLARRLEVGMVNVNDPPATFPQTPFAGFKESGLGFEQGLDAVEAYTRRKNILVNYGGPRKKK